MTSKIPLCPNCSSTNTIFEEKVKLWECQDCDQRFEDLSARKIDPQTIFLSYAHKSEKEQDYDISEDLVLLVKAALEQDRHTVWIDKDGIRGGHNWRENITRAILSHDHFLSFLSKRSVRDPGVCLNEIAIALDKGVNFQTVLTEPEEIVKPPITVTDTQWHQFVGWKEVHSGGKGNWDVWFEERMKGIRAQIEDVKNARAPGELTILRRALDPKTFHADIAKKAEGFFGRKWLFESFDQWLDKTEDQIFWLQGSPGIGKSAFAAKLVHQSNSRIMGFFKCDFQALKNPEESAKEVICTLAYQLATRMPDYRAKLLYGQGVNDPEVVLKKTADDLFKFLITEPLNKQGKIVEGQRSAIVIDALDEAGRNDGTNPLLILIKKHAPNLPDWLGIVITSRPEGYIVQELADIKAQSVSGDTTQNTQDLKDYLDKQLDLKITGDERVRIISQIINKSDGAFLYISQILKDKYDLTKPELLPKGMDGYFMENFGRYFKDAKEYGKDTEPFLELMVAAPGPLPKRMGQELLGWADREVTMQVTEPMGSLLQEKDGGLIFFHKALSEWLQDPKRSGRYQVNLGGSKKLGEFLCKEFEKNELKEDCKKPRKFFGDWEKQIIEWLALLLPGIDYWNNRNFLKKFDGYLYEKCKYKLEVEIRRQYLELTLESFSENSDEVGNALNDLANILSLNDKWDESELLYRRSLEIAEKNNGPEGFNVDSALNNLGVHLCNKGLYKEAEIFYRRALKIRIAAVVPDDMQIAESLANLAIVLTTIASYQEAEELLKKALEMAIRVNGPNHKDTVFYLNSLANTLYKIGQCENAEKLYRRALEIKNCDKDQLLESLSGLGDLLRELHCYDEAESFLREALQISTEIFGARSVRTGDILNNLGLMLRGKGILNEAEPFLMRALEISELTRGSEHAQTATNLNNLALVMEDMGKYVEAENFYRRALEIRKYKLGKDHPSVARTLLGLGISLAGQNRFVDAELSLQESLAISKIKLPPNHPVVGRIFYELGQVLRLQNRIDEAKEFYLKEIDLIERNEGKHSSSLISTYRALGVMLRDVNKLDEAASHLEKALFLAKKNNQNGVYELISLAKLRQLQGLYQESEDLYIQSLKIEESCGSKDDINWIRGKLYELYLAWGRPSEAIKYNQANLGS